MYCPSCGEENVDEASFCADCGGSLTSESSGGPPPHVPNHLVWAILVTIFCCLPFGIVSIVYAAQVNGKLAVGDIDGARQASQNAKTWAWVSFGISVGILGLIVLFNLLVGVYAILGPIGIILLMLPALVALAIWLIVRNSTKRERL